MSARAARRTAFAALMIGALLLTWVIVRPTGPSPAIEDEPGGFRTLLRAIRMAGGGPEQGAAER